MNCSPPLPPSQPADNRPSRPSASLLHKTVRKHLETYLATAGGNEDLAANVPVHVQVAYQRGTSEIGQASTQGNTLFTKLSWVF